MKINRGEKLEFLFRDALWRIVLCWTEVKGHINMTSFKWNTESEKAVMICLLCLAGLLESFQLFVYSC